LPELPEVETIVRDLADSLPGRTIREVDVLRPDLIEDEPADAFAAGLRGRRVLGVTRRAKNIVVALDDGCRLAVNLGMTGRLLLVDPADPRPSHPGVRMALDDGRELLYHDVRRFGRLWRMDDAAFTRWEARLGLEPLGREFTAAALAGMMAGSRVPVKTWLMDQARVVGVGNIYASEALFRARVDPRRPARDVTADEVARIRDGVVAVLEDAIAFRGTTFLDYRDARGERGGFAARLQVYDREGQPCVVCGTKIERMVQAGRSTFFCPACQAAPRRSRRRR
jgi:formamidopyrimidine-DNA glycosylase